MIAIKPIHTDVLIIGSGGAGLRCALELHKNKVNCLIVGKCKKREAHTRQATGGINAALGTMDPQDSWQMHAADTIEDGGFINDPHAVELVCKNAPQAVKELAKWGAKFHREKNKKISQRFFGAATFRRACFIGDQTGLGILNTLVDQVLKKKIPFTSEVYIFSLLTNKGKVNGALGLDMKTGDIITYHCKAVVLATGGHSRMFARSSSHFWENNGDGIHLAYDVGAKFMDMELFQFHPTGMVWPKEAEGVLVTEAVRGEGGILTNAKGERFMKKYDPDRLELSARDTVSQAIFHEVAAHKGTKRGGVYLDISHRPKKYILQRLPLMYKQLKKYCNVDISKEKMEIAPTAHYSMGGIKINHSTGSTGVPHLFAIGEVTAGVHGGNRLGGNSLAEITVFGRLTGEHIAKQVKHMAWLALDEKQLGKKLEQFENTICPIHGRDPLHVKKDIQEMMWHYAGVIRKGSDLKKGLKELEVIKGLQLCTGTSRRMNEQLIAALDVQNMIPTCEMILKSALYRKESRRAHQRSDYPKTYERWRKNIICSPTRYGVSLSTRPVPKIPYQIQHQMDKKRAKSKLLLE